MSAESPRGTLPPCQKDSLPPFPGMIAAVGLGVVYVALAQGSGELIWWPDIIAEYGSNFLLLPACLLQFPIIHEIGGYALLASESIFQEFIRLSRVFALLLGVLMTLSFLWYGLPAIAYLPAITRIF